MGKSNFVWKCHFQTAHEKSCSDLALLTGKYLSPQNFHINPSLLSVGLDTSSRGGGSKRGARRQRDRQPCPVVGATGICEPPAPIAANTLGLLETRAEARRSLFQRTHGESLVFFQNQLHHFFFFPPTH